MLRGLFVKKIFIVLSYFFLIAVVAGIVLFSSVFLALPAIENFVEDYYSSFNDKKFDYMYNRMTAGELKKAMTSDEYKKIQTAVYNDIGPVKEWEKGSTGIKYTREGFFVTVPCVSEREKGVVVETFTLKRDKKAWLLHRFDIKS